MTTILASTASLPTTWPAAIVAVAGITAVALIMCTFITGCWPWERD